MQWSINNGTSREQITANLQKNIFVLTGAINEIMQAYFGEDSAKNWDDLSLAFTESKNIGQKMGQIMRVVFGFSQTVPKLATAQDE